jgi:hypothetical protein
MQNHDELSIPKKNILFHFKISGIPKTARPANRFFLQSISVIIFLIVKILHATAQPIDSTIVVMPAGVDSSAAYTGAQEYDESNDFSPGLLFFAIAGLALMLISATTCILLFLLSLLLVIFLASTGIISVSLLAGLYRKSLAAGIKTFIVLTSSITGMIFCAATCWLVGKIQYCDSDAVILASAVCGLVGGLVAGLLIYNILRRFADYLKQKLNLAGSHR